MELSSSPSSLEVSKDGSLLTITHGNIVSFWDADKYVSLHQKLYLFNSSEESTLSYPLLFRLEKLREFTVPTQVNSASLHPDKTIFVCGGEDFKMYKFNYTTGTEIGK